MLNEPSDGIWISLDDRPPPRSRDDRPGGKCWCWFRFQTDPTPALGYLAANGRVRLLRRSRKLQNELLLDTVTHWKPMSDDRLQEFERRA